MEAINNDDKDASTFQIFGWIGIVLYSFSFMIVKMLNSKNNFMI
jgi:hypothetical protein